MSRARSLKVRLSLVFLFLFLLVIVLGIEALGSLSYVNDASAQIRVRWLPSTRALGDLNNLTTDFPAAEATLLRVGSGSERATALQQMADLDRGIAAAQVAYRQIHHDAIEDELYARFETKWRDYRGIVAREQTSPMGSAADGAKLLQEQASKAAYSAASDLLGMLTDRNVASAREASEEPDRGDHIACGTAGRRCHAACDALHFRAVGRSRGEYAQAGRQRNRHRRARDAAPRRNR
jgi:hypothetical protein